ncbi:MAG: cytoplasmic protein [Myxococcota bacterium]
MKKIVIFAFNGEKMCFIHVLLNILDFYPKGYDTKLVIEGEATKLITEMEKEDSGFHVLYSDVKNAGLIDAVCIACSKRMGAYEVAREQGLNLVGDMNGHPSMEGYSNAGYQIITM